MGDKYIVTAAHCLYLLHDGSPPAWQWITPSEVKVRVGDTTLDEEFEATSFTIEVANIKQHPDYESDSQIKNDIAVLELTEPVSLTEYPNIKPICLPEAGALFPGEAIMSGWG